MLRRGGPARSQIALEFMIVYSIVLVIFVVFFAVISNERSVTLASQQSSIMQLEAQTVAGYINQALQSGSGYTITSPLTVGIGTESFNISISSGGIVIAQTTVGKQVIRGVALSEARSLIINGTLIAGSGQGVQLYRVPAYSGSISVSNVDGIIFVDEAAPLVTTLVGAPAITQPDALVAPYFNGANSLITAKSSNSLTIANSLTLSAWVEIDSINTASATPYLDNPIIGELSSSAQPFMLTVSSNGIPTFLMNWGGSFKLQPSYGIAQGVWYNLAATYNESSHTETLYINGNVAATSSTSVAISGSSNVVIGASPQNGTHLNGYIADAQIYNTALPANQISALYSAGPAAAPTAGLANLVGWWPLNGNANDYSGYANGAAVYNTVYTYAVDTQVQLLTKGGTAASGIPLGIASTNGLLSGGDSLGVYTSASGLQRTLMAAQGYAGSTFVQAEAFNGNISTVRNLVGWWPVGLGSSNTVYDYSERSVRGTFLNPGYGYLENRSATITGQFAGGNSIAIANTIGLNPGNITIAAWFQPTSFPNLEPILTKMSFAGAGDTYALYLSSNTDLVASLSTVANGVSTDYQVPFSFTAGTWYFGALTYLAKSDTVSLYINGTLIGSSSNTVSGPLYSSVYPIEIGYNNDGHVGFVGNISDVQLYNTSLSASQIRQLYLQGHTSIPMVGAGAFGWWPLSGSGANYANVKAQYSITTSGVSFASVKYFNGSAQGAKVPLFNGANSVIKINEALPGSALCNLTIAAWVYDSGLPGSSYGGIFNFSNTGTDASYISDNSVTFYAAGSSSSDTWSLVPGYSLKGSWNLVGTTLKNGTITGYLNGVAVPVPGGGDVGCINAENGAIGDYNGNHMNGSIVDVQAYNTSLTNFQMQQLYIQGVPPVTQLNTTLG